MGTLTKDRAICGASGEPLSSRFCRAGLCGACVKSLLLALLAAAMMLSACGGGSSGGSQENLTLSGNWQFTMSPQIDSNGQAAFLGGLQGGFIVQNGGAATGAANYAVSLPQLPYPCNSGSAAITGTVSSGQNVALTAIAGTQTFILTGTLSLDGSTMMGTYTSTGGTAPDGSACGSVEPPPGQNLSGLQWSAVLVPPITGGIQGSFHSTGGTAGLSNQDFPVSGSLTQAANTGASNAAVTGILNFINPATNVTDYPCFDTASVYGQISGNSVTLQIVGSDGKTILGQIGEPAGSNGVTGLAPVSFVSAHGGYILNGVGPSYIVATSACPGGLTGIGSQTPPGDYGNLCLAVASALLGTTSACQEPVTLTPAALTFPAQTVGTTSTQTITLANTSGTTQMFYLTLMSSAPSNGNSDFTASDDCTLVGSSSWPSPWPSPWPGSVSGASFSLIAGQSCAIAVTDNPQESGPLTATLTVTSPVSADNDKFFAVPITGTGISEGAVSTRAINFGAEGVSKASLPQLPSFANHSGPPVQTPASPGNRTFQDVEHHAEID